jgi:hypothetical protein
MNPWPKTAPSSTARLWCEKLGGKGKEEAVRLVESSEEKHPVAKLACELDVSAEAPRSTSWTPPTSTAAA